MDTNVYLGKILPVYIQARVNSSLFKSKSKVILQQDNAPAHTSNRTVQFLGSEFSNVWRKGFWPGSSSDLNVIENLWYRLKISVTEEPRPMDRKELIARTRKTWKSNPVEYLPRRIEQVISAKGDRTDY